MVSRLIVLGFFLGLFPASVFADRQAAPQVSAGDFTISAGEAGFSIMYRNKPLSLGSYFNVFNPGYKGSLLSNRDAWRTGRVTISPDQRTLTVEGSSPGGSFSYSAFVSENGAKIQVKLSLAPDAVPGPVECAWFQIPPALCARGRIEVQNVAGALVDNLPIPETPRRGAMAKSGDAFTISTPEHRVVISTTSAVGLYPFDARVLQYGDRQGLWAFSSLPVVPGAETIAFAEVRMAPPEPPPRAAGTISLAPDVPATAVALSPDASERERFAAEELVSYLAKISGRKLDIVSRDDPALPAGTIAVGRLAVTTGLISHDALDGVGRDGYVVKVAQGRGGVCGWNDVGTIYAAYALLGRIGVRFYAPGCESVPDTNALVIPACSLSAKPLYEFRKMTQNLKLGHTPNDDLGNPADIGEPGCLVHAAAYLLPYEKYHKEHPEYFALQKDGQRLRGEPGQERFEVHLCLSNPEVRRICTERLLALIEKQKDRTFFGVSQGDGFAWCHCEKCKAYDAIPGVEMTDRLLDYVNEIARVVAKRYPDKRILTLAYTDATSPPPRRVLPEANVMVQYCPYPRRTNCQSHYLDCEQNVRGFEDLKGWTAACPDNMYIFDYPRGYMMYYEPFGSFYAMKRKLDFYAANKIRGIFYCGVPTTFQDLFVYVQSRLLWDSKADVEALIDEFMAVYYGKAAPHMRDFFNFLHREVEDRRIHQMCEGPNPGLVTASFAAKAYDMFDRAEAVVAQERILLYRVRQEKFNLLFSDLNERNPGNGKLAVPADAFARRLAEFAVIARAMKVRAIGRRCAGVASDWLCKVARIRTRVEPWYADPMIDRLIADPVKTMAEEQRRAGQSPIEGGWLLDLGGFSGGDGPAEYNYQCPPRKAVWIYGKRTTLSTMAARLYVDQLPRGNAALVLLGQDDDKPGAVRVKICVNGKEVFAGPNPFKERDWSSAEFAVPAGILRSGENEIRFTSLEDSDARDAKWFMLAECKVLFR